MKSYLDLVRVSTKVRARENRMAIACIVLAVLLVTTIFGMADMYIRAQIIQLEQDNGRFHVGVLDVTDEDCALIAERPGVSAAARYGVIPYEEDAPYTLFGHSVLVAGCDEQMMTDIILDAINTGHFPKNSQEVMLTQNAHDVYGVDIGEKVTLSAPDGRTLQYTVSGFVRDSAQTMSEDGFGALLSTEGFRVAYAEAKGMDAGQLENTNLDDVNSGLYVQFVHPFLARHEIAELKAAFHLADDQVVENIKLLGLYGQSSSSELLNIYASAAVLGGLVLVAGVLMIASSLNTNVAQRTAFYGMMRCLGATPKQVMRLVRREALYWCRVAIPLGVGVGVVLIWLLCAVLRGLAPNYFAEMPSLGVSVPAILAGVVLGILTVFFASASPAKRASKVSPLVAVSNVSLNEKPAHSACDTRHLPVEVALGVHHACASRKNLILMTLSFAFSIILFLGFSVAVDMMHHGLRPLQPWTADVSLVAEEDGESLSREMLETLAENDVVTEAYGRMVTHGIQAETADENGAADLVSYDARQFAWAEDVLISGDLSAASAADKVLSVYQEGSDTAVGDKVTLSVGGHSQTFTVSGVVAQSPYLGSAPMGTYVCSEETFRNLTGKNGYETIDLKLSTDATDAEVNALRAQAGNLYGKGVSPQPNVAQADEGVTFIDDRLSNASARGTYYCFALFVYGFLAIIALIAVFNITNSIAMSVTSRTHQYGVFRAIGLTMKQLRRMVVAEALTYTLLGGVLGTALGMGLHAALYQMMITKLWGTAWTLPDAELFTILLVMVFACAFALWRPLARLSRQNISEMLEGVRG